MPAVAAPGDTRTWRLELCGRVQGVGFRPFVYRLAHELGLRGEVLNCLGTVRILAQGDDRSLEAFRRRLIADAPPLAKPQLTAIESVAAGVLDGFRIRPSDAGERARIFVPPDCFMCAACAAELGDTGDRRYHYPFINCTQCGPRYTLIERLPYDRANTGMARFPLCDACQAEYLDPASRRFHAEPIACPDCGPQISFETPGGRDGERGEAALQAAVATLRSERVLAVKGIGGYHLLCDAASVDAVARLRSRKQRPDKPVAVMFPCAGEDGLDRVRECVRLGAREASLVLSAARPVVLAKRREGCALAANVAPALREVGVLLPYSPLHQLLLDGFAAPLVATSGNLSGEPVLTDNVQAALRLSHVADAFLHHDRPITRPADDGVFREIAGRMRPLRIGRGGAPLEMELPLSQTQPVLCVGGHLKATVSLSWDDRAVVSPHIGDMDSPRSLAVFEQVVGDLQDLYGVRAERIICDAHPGYATNRWARRQNRLPVTTVWHHRAHAAALAAETGLPGPWLIFTWDGVGLGEDRSLWGGEALLGECGDWKRVCSLRPFRPPGGDRAGREPWRSAAALIWETGRQWRGTDDDIEIAHRAWRNDLNCPRTSAAGRLFDAAAALICGVHRGSYEAQGPMQLEALARRAGSPLSLPLLEDSAGVLRSDWEPLLDVLCDDRRDTCVRAEDFHSSMARVIVDQAVAIRACHEVRQIGLAGGVFQNRLLTEQALTMLEAAGFDACLNRLLPANDAGLSFGQAAEWAARCEREAH